MIPSAGTEGCPGQRDEQTALGMRAVIGDGCVVSGPLDIHMGTGSNVNVG